jgi:hypothetical protein
MRTSTRRSPTCAGAAPTNWCGWDQTPRGHQGMSRRAGPGPRRRTLLLASAIGAGALVVGWLAVPQRSRLGSPGRPPASLSSRTSWPVLRTVAAVQVDWQPRPGDALDTAAIERSLENAGTVVNQRRGAADGGRRRVSPKAALYGKVDVTAGVVQERYFTGSSLLPMARAPLAETWVVPCRRSRQGLESPVCAATCTSCRERHLRLDWKAAA